MPTANSGDAQDTISLRQIIAGELSAAENNRREFPSQRESNTLERAILALCILTNILFFVTRKDYIVMFVAASFYVNMFYFITLLVPTNPGAADLRKPEIAKFHTWLRENGITSGTRQFTRIFINTFFMNSRTLTFAIGLIFSIDIVFTLIAYSAGLPLGIALFVIIQSAVIIIFYGLIWKVEPFTTEFAKNIDLVRTRLSRELPPWFISLLFLTGFLVVVFLFLTTIILLPGVTLNAFLTESGLTKLAYMFLPLGVLAISQYFIIRSIHGKTSRAMAERLMDYRENVLRNIVKDAEDNAPGSAGDAERRYEVPSLLLESRIYQIKRNSLLGAFPVYVVELDFSVMLDTTTLTAIKGYIRKS
ncbi:MAG: hypothetical protein ABSG49_04360 [Methanoregula sp.]|jgi:hypothetical protein